MASDKILNVVVFDLAGHGCAISSRYVQEAVPMSRLARFPGLPSFVEGIMNLRGEAISVLRLGRLLRLDEEKLGMYTPLLVLKRITPPVAIILGKVRGLFQLRQKDIANIHKDDVFKGCATAELTIDGEIIYLLSPQNIMLERERSRIVEFQSREQERIDALDAAK